MPEKNEIKKALDRLLGDEFTAEELQNLHLYLKVATWNRIEEGYVTTTSPIFQHKSCEAHKLLEVSGVAATGANGRVQFRLKDFICLDQLSFNTPIHVLGTPLGSRPIFLTVKHSLVMDPSNSFGIDVNIEAFTWDANGAAAPKIPFNWYCRVPFLETIF